MTDPIAPLVIATNRILKQYGSAAPESACAVGVLAFARFGAAEAAGRHETMQRSARVLDISCRIAAARLGDQHPLVRELYEASSRCQAVLLDRNEFTARTTGSRIASLVELRRMRDELMSELDDREFRDVKDELQGRFLAELEMARRRDGFEFTEREAVPVFEARRGNSRDGVEGMTIVLARFRPSHPRSESHCKNRFTITARHLRDRWGAPTSLGGDLGPWLRWTHQRRTGTLHYKRAQGIVELRWQDTVFRRSIEVPDVFHDTTTRWIAYARTTPNPSSPPISDWRALEARLSALLGELAVDAPILRTQATVVFDAGRGRIVQTTIGARVEASVTVGGGRLDVADPETAHRSARDIVTDLRDAGVDDLSDVTYRASLATGETVYLPSLGIRRATD